MWYSFDVKLYFKFSNLEIRPTDAIIFTTAYTCLAPGIINYTMIIILCIGRGAIRLIRNNVYSTIQAFTSGIVETYYSHKWGNICDDVYFGSTESDVICHQLGYTGASSYGNTGSTSMLAY